MPAWGRIQVRAICRRPSVTANWLADFQLCSSAHDSDWQGADGQIVGALDTHDVPKAELVSPTAVPPIADNGYAGIASGLSIDSLGGLSLIHI